MKKNGFLFFAIAFAAVLLIGFHAAPSGAATSDCTSLCQNCHLDESLVLYHPGWQGGPVMCIECHQQNRTMCSDSGLVHSGTPEVDIVAVACKGCHGAGLCGSSFTEAQLREAAISMHGGIVPSPARFNWYHGSACYSIAFDATMNTASSFCWDFGDGSAEDCASGAVVNHTYAAPGGSKSVTLTLDEDTLTERSRTMIVSPRGSNARPDAGMTVAVDTSDDSGMSVIVTDNSDVSDGACGVSGTAATATILWGDGTVDVESTTYDAQVKTHQYGKAGTWTIRYSIKDSNNNSAMASPVTVTVPANSSGVGLFTITGTLNYDIATTPCFDSNNDSDCTDPGEVGPGNGIFNANIAVKNGGTIVKFGKSGTDGKFSISGLVGGPAYTVVPTKNGVTFSAIESGTTDTNEATIGDPVVNFEGTLD